MERENPIEEAAEALERIKAKGRPGGHLPGEPGCSCSYCIASTALASLRKAAEGAEVLYRDNKQMCFALPEDLLRCPPSIRAGWHRVLVLRIQDGAA